MATYDHFYDLPVYQKCRSFKKNVSQIVKTHFPKSEDYHLKAQVLASSRSVPANIAEGFGRFHYRENIQFCRQSRGSLTETMDHLIAAFDGKACLKELNIYIKYLKSAKEINQ